MIYNHDPLLFRDAPMVSTARAYTQLTIQDGSVIVAAMAAGKTGDVGDIIAQCGTQPAAVKMLKAAESWIIVEDDHRTATAYSRLFFYRVRGGTVKPIKCNTKKPKK